MAYLAQQNQAQLMETTVLTTLRHLSGTTNNFVGENVILNALLKGQPTFGLNQDALKMLFGSLVQRKRVECFVPLANNLGSCGPCGPCGGCGSDCCGGGCGGCGGGCCGCGRYYRVKIG